MMTRAVIPLDFTVGYIFTINLNFLVKVSAVVVHEIIAIIYIYASLRFESRRLFYGNGNTRKRATFRRFETVAFISRSSRFRKNPYLSDTF